MTSNPRCTSFYCDIQIKELPLMAHCDILPCKNTQNSRLVKKKLPLDSESDEVPTGFVVPSGKHAENYGKSPFSMGKSTISMAIFNSYV